MEWDNKTIILISILTMVIFAGIFINHNNKLIKQLSNTNAQIKDLTAQNELLRTKNTAQLNKLMENAKIIQLQNDFLVEIEPTEYEPVKCSQDNTAFIELFNKCTFLDTENYQYVQFPIGVNVSELLNPKTIHSHSTTTEYITETEYIVCDECPERRCPDGQKPQCLSTNACGCSTDCSCVGSNVN